MATLRTAKNVGRARRAQLVADVVSVLCPFCGEPQPSQDGSEQWTAEDFRSRTHERQNCTSCEAAILIGADSKVIFDIR